MATPLRVAGLAALLAALGIAGILIATVVRTNGYSTRTPPRAIERIVTQAIHRWSIPATARAAANPVPFSSAAWTEAQAHFADHCASCHANDGSGDTAIGRNLYPRAPDMRLADTQRLTDGELYWIIENGVRLTGMPAWGAGGPDDTDTWKLVHFIRHLAHLTPDDLERMKALNPRTPAEIEEEREDQRFLNGDDTPPPSSAPAPHHH